MKPQAKDETYATLIDGFLKQFFDDYGTILGGNDGNGTNKRIWVPGLTWRRLYRIHFGAHWRSLNPSVAGLGNTRNGRRKIDVPSWTTFMRAKQLYADKAQYKPAFCIKTEQ